MFLSMKYVSLLSKDEIARLKDIMKNDVSSRMRSRAHSILLSAKDFTINEISDILEVNRRTVSSWIDSWEQSRFIGLPDKPRSGRPAKLTEQEKEIAKKLIGEHPQSLRTVAEKLAQKTGKNISTKTLKRLSGSLE